MCPGMRHTAYCEMGTPLVARRPYSYTSVQELGKELDASIDQEHWVFVVLLLVVVGFLNRR